MESDYVGPRDRRRRDGIAKGQGAGTATADPGSIHGSRRAARYGLGLLFVALCVGLAAALFLTIGRAHADSALDDLIERLDRLEAENRALRREIEDLKDERTGQDETAPQAAATVPEGAADRSLIATDSAYGYEILDPTTDINRKQRLILERRRDGTLVPDSVNVQGAVTAIADFQTSNKADKFGYLMRHPTSTNQVGGEVSEAAIHSTQLGLTATLGDWITGHAQILFDPEQSFGAGTNTDLERNQLQMRRAYALLGNLDRSPFFVSLGKMAVPFGLTDTVNPFTASTVWHAFGAMANGATVGYASDGLNLSVMAVQGGGAVPRGEHAGGGDGRAEQAEQPRRGRALRLQAGRDDVASPGRIAPARLGILPRLSGHALPALRGTITRRSTSMGGSSRTISRSRRSSHRRSISGPEPSIPPCRSSRRVT